MKIKKNVLALTAIATGTLFVLIVILFIFAFSLKKQIPNFEDRIAVIEASVPVSKTQIADVNTAISSLQTGLRTAEGKIDILETWKINADIEIIDLGNTMVATDKEIISDLEKSIKTAEKSIRKDLDTLDEFTKKFINSHTHDTLNKSISTLETWKKEANLQTRVKSLEDKKLDTRITTLEGANLQARVMSLENKRLGKPNWDSGWKYIDKGKTIMLKHDLGGDPNDYLVDLQFWDRYRGWGSSSGTIGKNNCYYGGDAFVVWQQAASQNLSQYRGAFWCNLNNINIKVVRNIDDNAARLIRVRIWKYE